MSDYLWRGGDVAMVVCSDGVERRATYRTDLGSEVSPGPHWVFRNGAARTADRSQARPVAVLDSEDFNALEHLVRKTLGVSSPPTVESLQAILRGALPQPIPVEPVDPSARVADAQGRHWARVDGVWVTPGQVRDWGTDNGCDWALLVERHGVKP